MAVGMLMAVPGFTREIYEGITRKAFGAFPMPADKAPDGLIVHSAGPAEQGWYVYDIWESKEHFQRFAENVIGPAMQELTGGAGGPEPAPQFFEIDTLVQKS